jgi:hypothetical protein
MMKKKDKRTEKMTVKRKIRMINQKEKEIKQLFKNLYKKQNKK